MYDGTEIFIRENLRPDLRAFLGPVEKVGAVANPLLSEPGQLLTRFSSCKESSTDGKEDKKNKEVGKDDKGAAGSPSGPVTDGRALDGSITMGSLAESAHANVFA